MRGRIITALFLRRKRRGGLSSLKNGKADCAAKPIASPTRRVFQKIAFDRRRRLIDCLKNYCPLVVD
jgi:hypothetical protein